MRKHKDKEAVTIYDFVDDFCIRKYPTGKIINQNYLYKHGINRLATYTEQSFKHQIFKVNF